MTKKEILIAAGMFVVIFSLLAGLVYFIIHSESSTVSQNTGHNIDTQIDTPKGPKKEDIPTSGNDTIYLTDVETRIRIINEYDKNLFTAKKNLLIMFGSWCPNCQEEIKEVSKIINYYKDNKDVNVILIAHEFKESDYPLEGIISLVENDVNYGEYEVLVDFNRIIRATIDPSANTVPISYVVDKSGKVLEKNEDSLTLDAAREMLK